MFSKWDVCFVCVLLVFCHLWGRSSEPRCLLQAKRYGTSPRGPVWRSRASSYCAAVPNCRVHTLHLGRWWMERSKQLVYSLSSYLWRRISFAHSPSVKQMFRCLSILLKLLLAAISTLSLTLSLCTIRWASCIHPLSVVRALVLTIATKYDTNQWYPNLRVLMAIAPSVLLNGTALCHTSRLFSSWLIFL